MRTITFDENTEEGRTLMHIARSLKKSTRQATVRIFSKEESEDIEDFLFGLRMKESLEEADRDGYYSLQETREIIRKKLEE